MDLSNPIYTKNKAYSYIFPLIGNEIENMKVNLINVYIGDKEYPELNNHIFLLYRFSGDLRFIKFEDEIAEHPLFVKSYDPDRLHVMKVFLVSEDLQIDYNTFLQSKYSQLSQSCKDKIVSYWKLPDTHPIIGVLYKKESAYKAMEDNLNEGIPRRNHVNIDRSQEASSILNFDTEIYNPSMKIIDPMTKYRNQEFKV